MGEFRGLTRIVAAAISFAATMILAGCGGGGSSDSASASGAAAGTAAYSPSASSSSSNSTSSSTSSSAAAVQLGGVTLDWTQPTQNTDGTAVTAGELAGYKILYGESPSALDQSVAITNPAVTTYTFQNLPSSTWYFAIVAVDSAGNESTPTNVISATT